MLNRKNISPGSFISSDGTCIQYERHGDLKQQDKIALLLHGLGGNLTAWEPQISSLTSLGYAVVAFDLRGHGLSGRPTTLSAYEIKQHAQDIYIFIKSHKLKHITLIGQCLGGMVALELVEHHKLKLHSLILIGTTAAIPWYFSLLSKTNVLSFASWAIQKLNLTWRKEGHMNVQPYYGTADIDLGRFIADISYMSWPSYFATCQQVFSFSERRYLPSISCPTLIIHGAKDGIFPQHLAHVLHRKIQNSQLYIIPRANHILLINNPEELSKAISKFLQEME